MLSPELAAAEVSEATSPPPPGRAAAVAAQDRAAATWSPPGGKRGRASCCGCWANGIHADPLSWPMERHVQGLSEGPQQVPEPKQWLPMSLHGCPPAASAASPLPPAAPRPSTGSMKGPLSEPDRLHCEWSQGPFDSKRSAGPAAPSHPRAAGGPAGRWAAASLDGTADTPGGCGVASANAAESLPWAAAPQAATRADSRGPPGSRTGGRERAATSMPRISNARSLIL